MRGALERRCHDRDRVSTSEPCPLASTDLVLDWAPQLQVASIFEKKGHCVVCVAEGAGQDILSVSPHRTRCLHRTRPNLPRELHSFTHNPDRQGRYLAPRVRFTAVYHMLVLYMCCFPSLPAGHVSTKRRPMQ